MFKQIKWPPHLPKTPKKKYPGEERATIAGPEGYLTEKPAGNLLMTDAALLADKMKWGEFDDSGLLCLRLCRHADRVLVWVVLESGEHVTLEDEAKYFPSDLLMGRLLLLCPPRKHTHNETFKAWQGS